MIGHSSMLYARDFFCKELDFFFRFRGSLGSLTKPLSSAIVDRKLPYTTHYRMGVVMFQYNLPKQSWFADTWFAINQCAFYIPQMTGSYLTA